MKLFGKKTEDCPKQEEVPAKDYFEGKVKCEECKHWIDEDDAQKISCRGTYSDSTVIYCPVHRKPYDRISTWSVPYRYYKEMNVDEKGTPVGYKKIAK